MEKERLAAIERSRQAEKERLDNEFRLQEILKEQMKELRQKEQEAELMKKQQDELLRNQWELERLEERRRAQEEERKKLELGYDDQSN